MTCSQENKNRYIGVAVLVLTLIPAIWFLNNNLIWDDVAIFNNYAGKPWSALLGPFLIADGMSYWRPLTSVTLIGPDRLGAPVWTAKAVDLLLYLMQGWLALETLRLLLKHKWGYVPLVPMVLMAVLLGIHPVFVETYFWIAARADLLLALWINVGLFWMVRAYISQPHGASSEATWIGAWRGFVVCCLACASKDTGAVWSALAMMLALGMAYRRGAQQRNYWRAWAAGVFGALLAYQVIRMAVLGFSSGASHLVKPVGTGSVAGLRLLDEFLLRSISSTLFPVIDQAPYKAAGWLDGWPGGPLMAIAVVFAGAMVLAVKRALTDHRGAGLENTLENKPERAQIATIICLAGVTMVVVHAIVNVVAQPTAGSAMSTRYIAPSVSLMAIASFLTWRPLSQRGPWRLEMQQLVRSNAVLLAAVLFVMAQSILIWTDARSSWTSNLVFWRDSWNAGSRNQLVANNYAFYLLESGNPQGARRLVHTWITERHASGLQLCHLYTIASMADGALGDTTDGMALSRAALDIGWCNQDLAQNIAVFLMPTACPATLPMLALALAEPDKPAADRLWQFENNDQKLKLLLTAAYAEARCGAEQRVQDLLRQAQAINADWAPSGPMATGLIQSARAKP